MTARHSDLCVTGKRGREGWRSIAWQTPRAAAAATAEMPALALPPALGALPPVAKFQALHRANAAAARRAAIASTTGAPKPTPATAPALAPAAAAAVDAGAAWRDAWQRLAAAGVDEATPIGLTCAEFMGMGAHLGRDRWPGCAAPVRLGQLVPAWGAPRPFAKTRNLKAAPRMRHVCAACTARHGITITRDVELNEAWVACILARLRYGRA